MPQSGGTIPHAIAPQIPQGGAFGGLAEAVGGAINAYQKSQDEQARAWTVDAVSQSRLQWTSKLADMQANSEPGAPEFSQKFVQDFDAYAADALENAPSDAARKFFHERLADIRTTLGEKAISFEAASRIDYRDAKFDSAADAGAKLVASDPGQFDAVLAEQVAVIRASAMPPKQREDREQKTIKTLAGASVWAQVMGNPEQFIQMASSESGLRGVTGNKAWDILPFDERKSYLEKAISLKNSHDADTERAAKKAHEELEQSSMKEALGRVNPVNGEPRLNRAYVEQIRPLVSASNYMTLLKTLEQGGFSEGGPKTNPAVFRDLQVKLRTDPEGALKDASTYHRNGLLANTDLSSIMEKADVRARQGGPKTEYERTHDRIVGRLDPGPMVDDPLGRSRLADALYEFDGWVKGSKRTDDEISKKGEDIVRRYAFVDFTQTMAGLPQPIYGSIRKDASDPQGQLMDIAKAWNKTEVEYKAKRITKEVRDTEASRLNAWRKEVVRANPVKK
jgi:hypothetical protein